MKFYWCVHLLHAKM